MFDGKGRFVMQDYGVKSTFASFLPGLAGEFGIPIWCFYVNRGQAVCSFGVSDKEHSIMEFCPAHQSYQNVAATGFRTFLRVDGVYYEPFRDCTAPKRMYIGMNELELEEENAGLGIRTRVLYFTLPGEALGALCRMVTVENIGQQERELEVLDGMPAILPFGITQSSMKAMGQTSKAWMQAEDVDKRMPYYRVSASMGDVAEVTEVTEGNFYLGMEEDGTLLPVIADPEVVFGYDVSLSEAVEFCREGLDGVLGKEQVTRNSVPCGFFGKKAVLAPGEVVTVYEAAGEAACRGSVKEFAGKCHGRAAAYFAEKRAEAGRLAQELCRVIHTESADPVFDAYCEQTYLDNVLRGGFPIELGHHIFYLYSRKHGDIERDYNFFRMLPEFYSQGNANFRDVNQNRRSDPLFTPYVGDVNIRTFYNLLQLDGYNPLSVEMASFTIRPEGVAEVLELLPGELRDGTKAFLQKPFTPGGLTGYLHGAGLREEGQLRRILGRAVEFSNSDLNAEFGEGYWTDHWTYNLDLVESFLAVYPDREEALLFGARDYTYYESRAVVNPRSLRYQKRTQGIRQYNAIDTQVKKGVAHLQARTGYGKGEAYRSNLAEKMVLLLLTRFAALDPYGMGLEMEAGKPGWYDALNGMPGLFGSSMAETCEASRLAAFLLEEFTKYPHAIRLPEEAAGLLRAVGCSLAEYLAGERTVFSYWDAVNTAKEAYREQTKFGVDGAEQEFSPEEVREVLAGWQQMLSEGICRAKEYGDGLLPCYFSYELDEYEEQDGVIVPKHFKVIQIPHFLEGPVRLLKLADSGEARKLYAHVKKSALYDGKLHMYKVNAPLGEASFEVGRARAFTPGWLENESIWLHMEYKYLLELLKAGLYPEFFADFHDACVPFLEEGQYGRSPLENSSFIASSANPNSRIHGKGFVARLSGSTAEFLGIWQIMMFGKQPFVLENGELIFRPGPAIPEYLMKKDGRIAATLLGSVQVAYEAGQKRELIPGQYEVEQMVLVMRDGAQREVTVKGDAVRGKMAGAIRDGQVLEVRVKVR